MGSPNVMVDQVSTPSYRGFIQGNQAGPFASYDPLPVNPATTYGDGTVPIGHGGITCPQRLFLLPIAQAGQGANFSMRLYGWRVIANPPDNGLTVWLPYLIAELACTTCNRTGPPNPGPGQDPYLVKDDERFCDTITLTQGLLGPTGVINSTGPGTDLIAYAIVELTGCRYCSFDFQQNDPAAMNVLWSRGP